MSYGSFRIPISPSLCRNFSQRAVCWLHGVLMIKPKRFSAAHCLSVASPGGALRASLMDLRYGIPGLLVVDAHFNRSPVSAPVNQIHLVRGAEGLSFLNY